MSNNGEDEGMPTFEVPGGLKIVDATQGELPPEVQDKLLELLVQAGVYIPDGDGGYKVNPNIEEGKMMGLEFNLDDDGDIENVRHLDDDEIPGELKRQ